MNMIRMQYRDWIPVRVHTTAHWRCYQSFNAKVFLGIDGEIYDFHLSIGRVSIAVEQSRAKYERKRQEREEKKKTWNDTRKG